MDSQTAALSTHVQYLDRKPRQQTLVAIVVHLCNVLGAAFVAEEIETYDEFRAICDCGAQYGQGSLFARPSFPMLPIAAIREPVGAGEPRANRVVRLRRPRP